MTNKRRFKVTFAKAAVLAAACLALLGGCGSDGEAGVIIPGGTATPVPAFQRSRPTPTVTPATTALGPAPVLLDEGFIARSDAGPRRSTG